MEFDEEGMNVFKQAVDDFIAAGESASFELAGRVLQRLGWLLMQWKKIWMNWIRRGWRK